MKKIIRFFKHFAKKCAIVVIRMFCPVRKNRIYFISNNGDKYACNPKAFCEYLCEHHKGEFEIFYCLQKKYQSLLPEGVKTAEKNSLKDIYYFQTAGVIVNNFRMNWAMNKRKKQYYVQTWHGGPIPQKMIEKDAEADLSKDYIKSAKRDSANMDLLMTGSDVLCKIFSKCFWYDGEVSNFGTPRYDKLLHEDKEFEKVKRKELGFSEDEILVLYAPTFRNNTPATDLILDNKKILDAFEKYFKRKVKMIYRFHPNQARETQGLKFDDDRVVNQTSYPDAIDLEKISDLLITDFSSVLSDFAMLKKPCFILCRDYDEYIASERKMYIDVTEYPYPQFRTEDEMIKFLNHDLDMEKIQKDIDRFAKKIGLTEKGNACESLYKKIVNREK